MRTEAILGRRDDLLPAALLRLASDQRLVEQVRAGSERAFETLFDRHHRPVLAFCRHMLGSKEEAEDVVQITFLAAYRDLGRAEPPAALRPWLYAIARHRCLSVLRARRERPVAEVALPATDRLAAEVATREDLRLLLADVAHLPDDQRAALVLAELGDVSHEEIARILACPREKVKALVFQARSSLLASRVARDTPCADIREQLATLRGGALRRTTLRRHLRECAACSAFRDQLRVQRRALGLLLPVAPGVGLKRMVLGSILGPGAGGAGGAAFTAAALSSGGLAAALVVLAIPGGGITAAANALGARGDGRHATPTVQRTVPASAWPLPRTDQSGLHRAHPGSRVPVPGLGERDPRPVQAGGADPADGSGQREPAPAQHAVPSEPPAVRGPDGRATPLGADEPPPAGGRTAPANPAKPAKPDGPPTPPAHARPAGPQQARGRPAPATPAQAGGRPTPPTPATPATPAQSGGRPAPTAPAGPSTLPQGNAEANPATPSGGAAGPPSAAAPGAAPAPAVAPPAPAPPKGP